MRRTTRPSEAGISLQELLIAMAIIGIIAIVTVPNFNAYMKVLRGQTEVNELVGALNLARQISITNREAHVFIPVIDPGNTWALYDLSANVVKEGQFPDGVTNEVVAAFQFDSKGACTNPTTYSGSTPASQYLQIEALIQGGQYDRYTIEVSPAGRIKTTRDRVTP
jgi:Tfp pilus assembly protein FimT